MMIANGCRRGNNSCKTTRGWGTRRIGSLRLMASSTRAPTTTTTTRPNHPTTAIFHQRYSGVAVHDQKYMGCWPYRHNNNASAAWPGPTTTGITRRWASTTTTTITAPTSLLQFPIQPSDVRSTERQRQRAKRIGQYGRHKQWQAILELFRNEKEEYGIRDLTASLTVLARLFSSEESTSGDGACFPRGGQHPLVREMMEAVADYLDDELVIERSTYAAICRAVGTLLPGERHGHSAHRIIHHLSNPMLAYRLVQKGTPRDIGDVAWSVAQLHRPDLMTILLDQMDEPVRTAVLDDDNPKALADIVWATAKLNLLPPQWFRAVGRKADWIVYLGDPHDIAKTVYACAKLGLASSAPPVFANIELRADWYVTNVASVSDLADVAWSCGTLGQKSPALFAAMENRADWIVAHGSPQSIANTVWACAKLGYAAPLLFATMESRLADWLVANGDLHDVANTAWACAKLGHASPLLFAAIEHRAESLVNDSNDPLDVSNLAVACATLGHAAPTLFAAIEKRADWIVAKGNPQAIANTVWAFTKQKNASPTLFAAMEYRADWLVETGSPQNIANTAWACARMGHSSPALFAAIEERADWFVATGDHQAISNTAWASARLGHESPLLFAAIVQRWDKIKDESSEQSIANTRWSFEKLGHALPP